MSTVQLTKWGNSLGIRIPSSIIKQAHLTAGEALQIIAEDNGKLTLMPVKNPQQGWKEMFDAIADSSAEKLLLEGSNDFDEAQWTW